mmetsp:Transcript_4757/g.13725  ORF Transcript_4757/g.13725 Transcript_4757/m.13725 type:complete len:322 (-) Transcript_4757:42-1007(-)
MSAFAFMAAATASSVACLTAGLSIISSGRMMPSLTPTGLWARASMDACECMMLVVLVDVGKCLPFTDGGASSLLIIESTSRCVSFMASPISLLDVSLLAKGWMGSSPSLPIMGEIPIGTAWLDGERWTLEKSRLRFLLPFVSFRSLISSRCPYLPPFPVRSWSGLAVVSFSSEDRPPILMLKSLNSLISLGDTRLCESMISAKADVYAFTPPFLLTLTSIMFGDSANLPISDISLSRFNGSALDEASGDIQERNVEACDIAWFIGTPIGFSELGAFCAFCAECVCLFPFVVPFANTGVGPLLIPLGPLVTLLFMLLPLPPL